MPEEIIHISKSEYNKMVETAKEIQSYTEDQDEKRSVIKFLDRNNFPTVKDMKKHNVRHNMRKYLPYLVFYSDPSIYTNDSQEFEESQAYIQELLHLYVYIVDDEDFAPVLSITPGLWKKSNLNQRANFFRALVEYYGINEFETFIRDLGWKKFMNAYGYSQKDFTEGKICFEMKEDLAEVWDFLQKEPIIIPMIEEENEENKE